jgi:hypothetical protein
MIGAQKTTEHVYQAIVGVGYPIIGNRRILRRRWKTKSEALKYMIDFFCAWVKLHPEIKPRAKKVARFS